LFYLSSCIYRIFLLYLVIDQDIVFWYLIHVERREETVTAFMLISANFIEDTVKNDKKDACFCSF
jgi:NADH:ubiquinone oxidoreductase subunit 3 (subunit A)